MWRALEIGKAVASRSRGNRERALVARHGNRRSSRLGPRDPLTDLRSLGERAGCDPVAHASLIAADQLGRFFNINTTAIDHALNGLADPVALDAVARATRAAALGHEGDRLETGVPEFIQYLALWWWYATGKKKRPSKRAAHEFTHRNPATFPHFAEAALADVGAGVGHSRAIRSALDELESRGAAPWTVKIANSVRPASSP